MQIEITEAGSNCTVNMSKPTLEAIFSEREMLLSDMALIKKNVFTVCDNLGLLNEDKTFKENISMTRLVPKLMGYLTNQDTVKKDFGFVAELLPLLSRYENL